MMIGITTYNEAMNIVSQYGMENNCVSLIETISMMEDNQDDLSRFQLFCMNIVLGEMEAYNAL
jgi:hypothetical protein